jgi:hypothetical protein
VWAVGRYCLPFGEIVVNGHLVVAATLEDEQWCRQRRGGGDRVAVEKVEQVGVNVSTAGLFRYLKDRRG